MFHKPIGCPPIPLHPPKNDQKVIIFDSPDGTGKSNIGYAMAQQLGIPYFKVNSEHQNWRKGQFKTALEFDQTYLIQLLEQTKLNVVIDRAYPAEWVYSQVYGRETNMLLLEELDRRFAKLGTNIIIPVREDYSKNRPDDLVKHDMLPKLHDGYMRFREWTKCKTITIYVDTYGENLKSELDVIVPELNFGPFSYDTFDVTLHRSIRNKFYDEDIKKAKAELFANMGPRENVAPKTSGRKRVPGPDIGVGSTDGTKFREH